MALKGKLGVVSIILILALAIGFYLHGRRTSPLDGLNFNRVSKDIKLSEELEKSLATDAQGLSHATAVMVTPHGTIKFKFYSKDAPITTHRMVQLIEDGFYNGLTFHRVIPGFVAQGGDPTGTGKGGSGKKISAELNNRKHIPGALAMARAADLNSADSQFYIALGTLAHLDGNYTVFGQVVEGQEVAKQLQVGDHMTSVTIDR